ncbi:hypothetical protein [Pasteurella canis]|uniref:hypothetical protein n=1 Tax=Pasteurella canis TaxID=753 RepID=UPI0037C771E2
MLQAGSIVCYDKLVADGKDPAYAGKLIQYGWETITEALNKRYYFNDGCLSNSAKLRAFELSELIKEKLAFLFEKHMDDIISGEFSSTMMADWANGDANLLKWREEREKQHLRMHQNTKVKLVNKSILTMVY